MIEANAIITSVTWQTCELDGEAEAESTCAGITIRNWIWYIAAGGFYEWTHILDGKTSGREPRKETMTFRSKRNTWWRWQWIQNCALKRRLSNKVDDEKIHRAAVPIRVEEDVSSKVPKARSTFQYERTLCLFLVLCIANSKRATRMLNWKEKKMKLMDKDWI